MRLTCQIGPDNKVERSLPFPSPPHTSSFSSKKWENVGSREGEENFFPFFHSPFFKGNVCLASFPLLSLLLPLSFKKKRPFLSGRKKRKERFFSGKRKTSLLSLWMWGGKNTEKKEKDFCNTFRGLFARGKVAVPMELLRETTHLDFLKKVHVFDDVCGTIQWPCFPRHVSGWEVFFRTCPVGRASSLSLTHTPVHTHAICTCMQV